MEATFYTWSDFLYFIEMLFLVAFFCFLLYGLIYLKRDKRNTPVKLPDYIVYTTMYIFKHEGNVAEITSVENLMTHKKRKRKKYLIPETCGRLESGKTYNFYKDKDGEFRVKQVAVFISEDVIFC